MSEIELVVPFSLPPPELAADLLRDLSLPALATILSCGRERVSERILHSDDDTETLDVYARSLPHEQWLTHTFGLDAGLAAAGSPPVAQLLMQSFDRLKLDPTTTQSGQWFIVQPVHLHIARDHLVLTDLRQLALSDTDSRGLFESAAPCFASAGMTLYYGTADYWFVRSDFDGLRTATPDASCGHNIDIWMPQGDSARAWRKLHNEIQMDWHIHAVNDVRTAAGLVPVNAAWLWGGSGATVTPDRRTTARPPAIFNFNGWLQAFGTFASSNHLAADPQKIITDATPVKLVYLDSLIGPALAGDWAEWRSRLLAIELQWLVPILSALKDRRVQRLSLVLSKGDRLQCWSTSSNSLKKFWTRPTLTRIHS